MTENPPKKLEIDYSESLRRMGLGKSGAGEYDVIERLLDTEDFEQFNDSFMEARERMVAILVNYGAPEGKYRTLRAMIAHDHTKRLMDDLMEHKREMEATADVG